MILADLGPDSVGGLVVHMDFVTFLVFVERENGRVLKFWQN